MCLREKSLGHRRAHGSKVTQAELQIRNPITMAYMAEGPADVDLILTLLSTMHCQKMLY